jgi:DMSO/TMAO reductase YedYZ molybdopterin-dependent catalytic subunit
VLTVDGDVRRPCQVDVEEFAAALPRHEQRADLHCVTTWSALDLDWSGWRFSDVYARLAERATPRTGVRWVVLAGLDGFRACLALADALAPDVLLADRLDGDPLPVAHGAPLRLVAPAHYGYKSVKHLAHIELSRGYRPGSAGWREHPRGRVGAEERSRGLPGPAARLLWRAALPTVRRAFEPG